LSFIKGESGRLRRGGEAAILNLCNRCFLLPNKRDGKARNRSWILKIALIVTLVLAGLIVAGAIVAGPQLRNGLTSFKSTPKGERVRTQTISMGKLTETVKAPGKIEPRTKVEISAEVAARIEDLPFREGQVVRKNDVIVKLDDRTYRAVLAASEARKEGEAYRLQSEQARLTGLYSSATYAKKQLERRQNLFDSGDLARKELDDAQERVDDLQAQIESSKHLISVIESSLSAAKADIEQTQDSLAKTIILAPMDGVITALNAEIGEVVLMGTMNNPGTVIMTIADLSRMILKAEVSESDIAKVATGQPARVHINAYRDDVFSGTVTQIALQRTEPGMGNGGNGGSSSSTGYFEAEVEIDLQGRHILSGLMANVDIEVASHNGLTIESQAIVDRSVEELPEEIKQDNPLVDRSKKTTTVAYRIVNDKTICTPVKRGSSDDTHSIVLAGLNEDDVVVVGPFKVLEKIKHDEAVIDEAKVPKEGESKPKSEESESPKVQVRVR
jgi:HlyD family secretion protein